MSASVFRRRDVEAFSSLHRQRVPRPLRLFVYGLILLILGCAAFLYLAPWVQTTSGMGTVTTLDPRDRRQDITALVSGRVSEWFVREGQYVAAGDPIARIIDNDPLLLERLIAERDAVSRQVESAQRATHTARLDYERRLRLLDDGLTSRLEYENARIKLEEMTAREEAAIAALERAEVNLSRQSIQVIRAPRDGFILRLNAGDTATFVREGQALATFLPSNVERIIELYVDGRDAPLVTPGRKVRLMFDGWPAVQFSGWPAVAVGTFGGEVLFVDPVASLNGKFRILIGPDPTDVDWPDEHFVRLGAAARGWVLLDTVRVGYEIWRRLNNFPPNFVGNLAADGENGQR